MIGCGCGKLSNLRSSRAPVPKKNLIPMNWTIPTYNCMLFIRLYYIIVVNINIIVDQYFYLTPLKLQLCITKYRIHLHYLITTNTYNSKY